MDELGIDVFTIIGPEIASSGQARLLSYVGKLDKVENWQQAAEQCKQTYAVAVPDMPAEFWETWSHNSYRENSEGVPELDMDLNIGEAIRSSTKAATWLLKLRKLGLLKKIAGMYIDPWDSFRKVSMPCLVLRGGISDVLSDDIVDRMAVIKPDLVRAIIPNRGHVPLLNEPESLAAIDAFLGSLTDGHTA